MSQRTQKNLFGTVFAPDAMPWEEAARSDRLTAQVVFNRPLETVFHYLVPNDLRELIVPGQRVKVPFGRGNRIEVGFCVGLGTPPKTKRQLKEISVILDSDPLLSPNMLQLTRWIADRYLCGWGQVLETVVPAGVKKKAGTRMVTFFQPVSDASRQPDDLKLAPKQQAVMQTLIAAARPMSVDELTDAAECGTGPINALRQKGLIQAIRQRTNCFESAPGHVEAEPDLQLNRDQQVAFDTIVGQLRLRTHRTILLHGVTASGKTEVYIQAIREVVSYGRQAIVLVPEISLTPQTIRRFRSRFDSVAVLHSHLSDAERHWQWRQIASGGVQVVVGARSAIFAPTPHLGLIVIDEEHETTFKQETTPRYHAREVARRRAKIENVPLVLGTATPTLESWLRVQRPCAADEDVDVLVSLPHRVENLPLPPVLIVDVRNDPYLSRGQTIGRALRSSMQLALRDGGQVILFLNLRGFSPTIWCRRCGKGIKCPACDISLTWHKSRKMAVCHFCNYETARPEACPQCNQPGLRYLGKGTQRLDEEVRALFGSYKALRMDSDTMRKPGSHDEALQAFGRGDVKILLGTQMIAKGLDFPNVTLVGVIDADTLLHQPDLRSAERTFQLIAQVAGRTGRSTRGGRVLVQTANPTEPAIRLAANHDFIRFAEHELQYRSEMQSPPYRHFARVVLRGPKEACVKDEARQMSELLRNTAQTANPDVRILGPAPAPIEKLKGNFRYHFQLSAEKIEQIQQLWRSVSGKLRHVRDVESMIDVDPINMR